MKYLSTKIINVCLVVLILILVANILLLGSTPPVDRDALTHHLAVPKLYLQNGGIYEIPHIEFSYYPMNLDLLYMVPLYFGNDIVPKYIHFLFALMTALLVFTYLKNRISFAYGTFGALLFLSIPVIVKLSITVYVDLGLIFFSTAALLYFLKWMEKGFKFRHLIYSAVFCGLALGTKYNGLVVFLTLASFVPFYYMRRQKEAYSISDPSLSSAVAPISCQIKDSLQAIKLTTVFVFIALLVFSPWMVRNLVWTGNPVYPLFKSLFSKESTVSPANSQLGLAEALRQAADAENKSHNPFAIRREEFQEPLWRVLLIPIRIFFEGRDDDPKLFDGRLNPLLFLLPMAVFIRRRPNPATHMFERDAGVLLSFSALFLVIVFFTTDMRIRYAGPIIPPLVILSAYGLHRMQRFAQQAKRGVFKTTACTLGLSVLMFLLLLNVSYLFDRFALMRPQDYLLGRVSRDFYIQQCRPEYAVMQYANRNLSSDTRILGLYLGNRLYYSDRELFFGDRLILKIVRDARSPQEVFVQIKEQGFTHIIVDIRNFQLFYGPNLTRAQQERLGLFFRDTLKLLKSHDGFQLFEI